MSGWRRGLRLGIGLVLAVAIYFVMPIDTADDNAAARLVLSAVMLAALAAGTIWQVVRHIENPDLRVDGLALFVVIGVLAFAMAYYRVERSDPSQFAELHTRLDSLYFAVSTLLTVGFGDVHAQGQTARGLVLVAMIFNVVVIATAVTTMSNAVRRRAQERLEARALQREESGSAPAHRPVRSRRTHRNPR
ncbi:potassium channel family protein [Nocardioides sp.]|uniref:potassium channel family protein n=1 Tax=Nocardioides sp. TaxID=35761 RepID=UPI003782D35D